MVINKIKFPIYSTMIILSLIIASIYIAINLHKNKVNKNKIKYYILMMFSYALFGGIILSKVLLHDDGLSSYAGAISVIIAAFIFEKIDKEQNGLYIKYSIISLPLIYGISKIGCFLAGCCYGIPYNGILSVTYTSDLNIPLFPIQLLESIVFIITFLILNKIKDKYDKYIIEITIIVCSLIKFLLDFLRYDHVFKIITKNQIISIVFIIVVIILIIKRNFKK